MIFHTAADEIYYNQFYNLYYSTIKQFFPDSKFSLYYSGKNILKNKKILYIKHEPITNQEIESVYKVSGRDTKGYYALSRWWSMPVQNEHVAVSDVDIIALKNIPQEKINNILNDHEAINITRTKKNGLEGGMNLMILRKDIIDDVNKNAKSVLNTSQLHWASDVNVREFIYANFKVYNLPEMHTFNKRSEYFSLDSTSRSFGIFKGGVTQKVNSLKKAKSNL
jgi:hypothetical protein